MMRWAVGAGLLLLSSIPAWAWQSSLPGCESGAVIGRIVARSTWADRHTWHTGVMVGGVSRIRETALRDMGPSHIARRYCSGVARLANGRTSELVYVIEAGQGFASIGWNVEFCLPPYDPYRVYDAWCEAIRPQ